MENSNSCHNNNIPIDKYYIDTKNNLLRKCHESCLSCSNGPILSINSLNIEDTNCEICINNYYKIINNSVYTIELVGVLKAPSYLEFNKYPIHIENYGDKDQESFYPIILYFIL